MTIELLIKALLEGKGFADTNTAMAGMEQKAKSASATAAAAIQQGPTKAVEELGAKAQTAGSLIAQGLGIDVGRRLMAGLEAIPRLMQNVAREGVAFNETIEDARLGIAGVLRQFTPGEYQTFASAFDKAGAAIDQLKLKALDAPGKFGELVRAFQAISGAASAARIPLEKQIDLVTRMSQTLGAMGIRPEQISQESRALITGNINEDAAAARMLGITRSHIENAREAGELYEFLTSKMNGFKEAAEAGSMSLSRLRNNLGDAFQQQAGKFAEPLTKELKELYKGLTEAVQSDGFKNGLKIFFESLAAVATAVAAYAPAIVSNLDAIMASAEALGWAVAGVTAGFLAAKVGAVGLSATMVVSPLLSYAAAFAAIGTAIRATMEAWKAWNARKEEERTVQNLEEQEAAMVDTITKVEIERRKAGEMSDIEVASLNRQMSRIERTEDLAARVRMLGEVLRWLRLQAQELNAVTVTGQRDIEPARENDDFLNELIESNKSYQRSLMDREAAEKARHADVLARINSEITAVESRDIAIAQAEEEHAARLKSIRQEAFDEWDKQWDEMGEKIAEHHRKQVQLEMQAAADRLRIERDEIALKKARIEADFRQTSLEKRSAILDLSKKEIEALDQVIATLKKKRDAESDDAAREAITGQITGLEGERRQAGINLAGMEGAASPGSFTDQFTRTMRDIREMWGGWAQEMAGAFQESFVGATNVISSNITGLIMMTQNWGQALQNISLGIMNSIVKAIVDMGVQWFMTHVFMRGVATATSALMRMLRRTETAETIAGEATKTPVLATNAAFATVSSWGAALATVALLAALVAGFAGAFADGGLIAGKGGPRDDMNFAAVSPGEFIVREAAVRKVGVPFLKAVNSGAAPAAAMGAMGGGAGMGGGGVHVTPAPVKVLVLNNRQEMMDALRSEAGRAAIVDAFNQSRVELGLPS